MFPTTEVNSHKDWGNTEPKRTFMKAGFRFRISGCRTNLKNSRLSIFFWPWLVLVQQATLDDTRISCGTRTPMSPHTPSDMRGKSEKERYVRHNERSNITRHTLWRANKQLWERFAPTCRTDHEHGIRETSMIPCCWTTSVTGHWNYKTVANNSIGKPTCNYNEWCLIQAHTTFSHHQGYI